MKMEKTRWIPEIFKRLSKDDLVKNCINKAREKDIKDAFLVYTPGWMDGSEHYNGGGERRLSMDLHTLERYQVGS